MSSKEQDVKLTDIGCFPLIIFITLAVFVCGYLLEIKSSVEKNTEVLEKVIDAIEAK